MASDTYLYAIARGRLPSRFSTVPVANPEAHIRRVQRGGLAAVVSEAPPALVETTRDNLLAHSQAIQELVDSGAAVLPLRFGTVFSADEAIERDLLEARRDELDNLLARVDGRVEMRLKAFYDEEVVLREIVAEDPEVRALQRETQALPGDATYYLRVRLGERVASTLAGKRERDAEAILSRLAPLAVDRVREEELHEWGVLTASFLVERPRVGAFESACRTLGEEAKERLRLTCTGPLAPYSFVDLALEPLEVQRWAS